MKFRVQLHWVQKKIQKKIQKYKVQSKIQSNATAESAGFDLQSIQVLIRKKVAD